MNKLLILGAGGHGKVVAEAALLSDKWSQIAFLDDNCKSNKIIGIPVIGSFADYKRLVTDYNEAFVAIGNNNFRLKWIKRLKSAGFNIPTIIHPKSVVSDYSKIGEGTVVMAEAVVNPCSKIGRGCIINTSCSIDHDCMLEDGVHISPGAHIAGMVEIAKSTWIGIGASIGNNIKIGTNVIVAAGATVVKNIKDNVMVAGTPAIIKKDLGDE